MDTSATGNVFLPVAIEGKIFVDERMVAKAEHAAAFDIDTNIKVMIIGSITCGHGDKKSHSSVKMWTCCECAESGMTVRGTPHCPNCGHHGPCGRCDQYKVKARG